VRVTCHIPEEQTQGHDVGHLGRWKIWWRQAHPEDFGMRGRECVRDGEELSDEAVDGFQRVGEVGPHARML
jgi:hypothetical protein